ncbi:unnamed protein product (macronuclear) [Paramecium tetraurelia]|uniref:Carboxypeptidase n=1 Tax=Paramecium tetraurelia TaxID=5888 RepID=A0BXC8_PARTE|nr:uncharacterized protein GSPATT00033048001 [Paramecium tetraurelia]CAK63195.1 unnamed protein product [Paramecium tetraurelia]|eukprot:XP_001430593.1 hypothetical protein (macronuclear) [Paramecium tetraurelia strain d4-2]
MKGIKMQQIDILIIISQIPEIIIQLILSCINQKCAFSQVGVTIIEQHSSDAIFVIIPVKTQCKKLRNQIQKNIQKNDIYSDWIIQFSPLLRRCANYSLDRFLQIIVGCRSEIIHRNRICYIKGLRGWIDSRWGNVLPHVFKTRNHELRPNKIGRYFGYLAEMCGPGCSSQFGNFQEIGPYKVVEVSKDNYKVEERPQSWNKLTHQLFVDQPLRVGMSGAKDGFVVSNTETAAKYFANFLRVLYNKHTILQRTQLYIMGESFAGHYIPAIAIQILTQKLTIVNFKGVAIGDGWTQPFQQFSQYASYLYTIGTITERQFKIIQNNIAIGQNAILDGNMKLAYKQFDLLSDDETINMAGGINVYNFRQYQGQDIEDTSHERFLNFYLKTQFKAPTTKTQFEGCDGPTFDAFALDIPTSRKGDIEVLLESNIKVLLFNGQLDYIVNTPGAVMWMSQLNWDKIGQWKSAKKEMIVVNKETQGTWKQYENFIYATIYTAGHMVPTDNPLGAYAMLEKFLTM